MNTHCVIFLVALARIVSLEKSPEPPENYRTADVFPQEDTRVFLSKEKRALIDKVQDPHIRGMLESAEIRAKKGEAFVSVLRNRTRISRQKAFFSMFMCAVCLIKLDLEDTYEYLNATKIPPSVDRIYTSAAVENLVVRRSGFLRPQIMQVNKFFRRWYACLQENRTEFSVNLGKTLESYARRTGRMEYANDTQRDFAGIMGRNYPYFSNLYHGIVPRIMAQFREGGEKVTFLEAFFNAIPRWYFTQKHVDYVNLLHEVLLGQKDAFRSLVCTNRFNEAVVIPYASANLCPSFIEPYHF